MFALPIKHTHVLVSSRHFRISALAFFALVAPVPQLPAQEPAKSTPAKDPNNPIVGEWKGAYFSFPEMVAVKLTVRSLPMDHIEGECELSPAVEPPFHNSGSRGIYHFKGTYTPWATEFSFEPDKWIDPHTNTMKPMNGVLDLRGHRLVGQVGEMGIGQYIPVLLGRQPNGDKLLNELTASAFQPTAVRRGKGAQEATSPLDNRASPSFRVPSVEKLVEWASRLKAEKPDLDTRHTYGNILFILAHNLFEDDYFERFFGATYDKLDSAQRNAVADLFRNSKNRLQLFDWSFLDHAFWPNGSNSAPDITMSLFWQRAMRSWMKERVESFAQLPANLQSMAELNSFQELGKTHLSTLWPSEVAKFKEAITNTRVRIATAFLQSESEKVIGTAKGIEGAQMLAAWLEEPAQKEITQCAPKELKEELTSRFNTRIDELIGQTFADESRAIANFGTGRNAVIAGNEWFAALMRQCGFAFKRPAFEKSLAQLQSRRSADLSAASSAITAEITAQETEQGLNSKLHEYLKVPGDDETEPGKALKAIAQKRLAEIRRDQYLTFFSRNERRWNPQRDGSLTPPAIVPAPDEEDVRVAIVRTMEMLGGERTAPYVVRMYLNPLAKAMRAFVAINVERVDALSCRADNGGFVCTYRVHTKNEVSDAIVKPGDPLQGLFQGLTGLLNFPQDVSQERFELGKNGWWSPGLKDRMHKASQRYNEELDSGMND
jgi:hypothetical protein